MNVCVIDNIRLLYIVFVLNRKDVGSTKKYAHFFADQEHGIWLNRIEEKYVIRYRT